MNFFAAEHHISVIADLKYIWNGLGHSIDDVCLSAHHHVMGRPRDRLGVQFNMADIVKHKVWEPFYKHYKDILKPYDGFVCCYPPCYAMLYAQWDKPIILQIPIRYNHPLDQESWDYFDEWLREHIDSGQVIVVANNLYDKAYFTTRVQRPCHHIPSLCEYTQMKYKVVDGAWLYYYKGQLNGLSGHILKKEHALPSGYAWGELLKYRGMVHIPYQVSTMSIFEQYTACIPMLFPSYEFLVRMYQQHYAVLSDMECVNLEWVRKYADYYSGGMRGIGYFDDIEELNYIVQTDVRAGMSFHMAAANVYRKKDVYSAWQDILNKLS